MRYLCSTECCWDDDDIGLERSRFVTEAAPKVYRLFRNDVTVVTRGRFPEDGPCTHVIPPSISLQSQACYFCATPNNALQTYTINTFLTHRWVVMLNGAEVQTWIVSERQAKQTFVLSKAGLA